MAKSRTASLLDRVRALCLALPEAFELETWDHPTFRVGGGRGKIFCTAAADGRSVTMKADPLEREALLAQGDPFYLPPYVGVKGWVGMRLDKRIGWKRATAVLRQAYEATAAAARPSKKRSAAKPQRA